MSNDTVKNYSKSIRGKLLNIAKEENIFYQTVLTRFFSGTSSLSYFTNSLP